MRNLALIALISCVSFAPRISAGESWQTSGGLYLWGAGIKGDVAVLPRESPAEVDASFSDIIEVLQFTLLGSLEFRRNEWAVTTEFFYFNLALDDIETPGPNFDDADIDIKYGSVGLAISRRFMLGDTSVDPLIGYRHWGVSNELDLSAGTMPARSADGSENWNDLVLGLRLRTPVSRRWHLSGYFSSAVAGDSDSMFDFYAGANYKLDESQEIIIGYRHHVVDFEKGNFLLDVALSGPLIGINFGF